MSSNTASHSQKIEDFIFVRELNEVFLLLDHISGRWDKSLYGNGIADDGSPHIKELCAIGLTPAESDTDRVLQAVRLLCAKDRLNAVARPATGMTIAFTLMVVGEENPRKLRNWFRNLAYRGNRGHDAAPLRPRHAIYWDMPTRLTLARYAFPGLIDAAKRFNRRVFLIVLLLLIGLVLTCVMSWHVTGGNVILQHLDALSQQHAAVVKSISDAELRFTSDEQARRAKSGAVTPEPVQAVQYCLAVDEAGLAHYRNTEEYQLCTRRRQIETQMTAVRTNLRNWLQPWKDCYGRVSAWFSTPHEKAVEEIQKRGTEELAQIVTLVVGTAVLPLCYGILGAGAAVVRGLWAKMRESLLSPRDYTLALLQLALGATIGACIALFINPSGQTPGAEISLLGNWGLSSSALSFIAGFGVEGVFLALESFVRRVFNVADPSRTIH
ncbi:hypothetical protein [Pseudoduganella sp. RAF53_2]|uniref:hypothetical protein n=1 Tax=unclassified Pseudoduganella TaxID=2637179 RepID=UPI003F943F7B